MPMAADLKQGTDGELSSRLRLGMFCMPASRPDTPLADVIDWVLEMVRTADRLGYAEAWIGQHVTAKWERTTSPQQIIARALADTTSIRLGTGVEVLYLSHPVTLATQLAQLDHMARGRLLFGFGSGSTATDHQVYGIDSKTAHAMSQEALEIILNCWQPGGPKEFRGKFWSVFPPNSMAAYGEEETHGWHIAPYAPAESRISFAGFQKNSPSLFLAGARGYIPMSLDISSDYLGSHWDSVVAGAASTGRKADRRRWRHAKEIYVAETNAEARRAATKGFLARYWTEYARSFWALFPAFLNLYRREGADPDAPITPEYLVDNNVWLVGDPDHVAAQIREQFRVSGGFGTLLQLGMDYADPGQREGWLRSMQLLAEEVLPRVKDLVVPAD
jgi:alkanesulfonate monooxygenase SsuD/methylene tetrahydromethanopterin reductase-like flavin-dependent oxidoreductase (luciferase family)